MDTYYLDSTYVQIGRDGGHTHRVRDHHLQLFLHQTRRETGFRLIRHPPTPHYRLSATKILRVILRGVLVHSSLHKGILRYVETLDIRHSCFALFVDITGHNAIYVTHFQLSTQENGVMNVAVVVAVQRILSINHLQSYSSLRPRLSQTQHLAPTSHLLPLTDHFQLSCRLVRSEAVFKDRILLTTLLRGLSSTHTLEVVVAAPKY
ncbi:hypothetical protein N7470_005131 [Penicillium chermesinum]|nr:hypothetical protein N7470_005131 [Penicillium chermesinum]